jgi:hypothetical protein
VRRRFRHAAGVPTSRSPRDVSPGQRFFSARRTTGRDGLLPGANRSGHNAVTNYDQCNGHRKPVRSSRQVILSRSTMLFEALLRRVSSQAAVHHVLWKVVQRKLIKRRTTRHGAISAACAFSDREFRARDSQVRKQVSEGGKQHVLEMKLRPLKSNKGYAGKLRRRGWRIFRDQLLRRWKLLDIPTAA